MEWLVVSGTQEKKKSKGPSFKHDISPVKDSTRHLVLFFLCALRCRGHLGLLPRLIRLGAMPATCRSHFFRERRAKPIYTATGPFVILEKCRVCSVKYTTGIPPGNMLWMPGKTMRYFPETVKGCLTGLGTFKNCVEKYE